MKDLTTVEFREDILPGELIDKVMTHGDQLIAEALGHLLKQRSLEFYELQPNEHGEWHPDGKITAYKNKYDRSRYGIDTYKHLAYKLVLQCMQTSEYMKKTCPNGEHDWKDFLAIICGPEDIKRITRHPSQYI